jgi:hypothetical protein
LSTWLLDQDGVTSWSSEADGSTSWSAESDGTTGWSLPECSSGVDALWAPWTDGTWWLDHDGAFVGWADWPPAWAQLGGAVATGGEELADYPLTDEDGTRLLDDADDPILTA